MALKIALTGTGYIAKVHARAVQNTPGAELVAVVNHRPESMRAFAAEFGIDRQYPDVTALLVTVAYYFVYPPEARRLRAAMEERREIIVGR